MAGSSVVVVGSGRSDGSSLTIPDESFGGKRSALVLHLHLTGSSLE